MRTPPKPSNSDELEDTTPRNSNAKKIHSDSPSSLLSPSTWFKSPEADETLDKSPAPNPKIKPPRFQRGRSKPDQNILSPRPDNLFTTFTNISPRRVNQTNDDQPPSPPAITDASTASSLLWEDNTLISVSDEDAVAFRMYESKMRQGGEPLVPKSSNEQPIHEEPDKHDDFSSRRRYRRRREFDGFDNVVLSVTIYSTALCESNRPCPTNRHRPLSSGEVVVLELLSTKNPPNLDQSASKQVGRQRKVSSSSSSQTNPPTQPRESDSSTVSSNSTSQQQSQINGEESASSSHTRILARRILRWPSSIMQLDPNKSGCPSLVSLGRTNIWEERKVADTQHAVDLKPRVGHFPDTSRHDVLQSSRHVFVQENRTDDALDAIRSLDFLFGGTITKKTEQSINEDKVEIKEIDSSTKNDTRKRIKMTQPLCLSLITNDGRVFFFHAMRVFLNHTIRKSSNPSGSDDFAALLFGDNLMNKVCDDVAPLTKPNATLELSQLFGIDHDPTSWNAVSTKKQSTENDEVASNEESVGQNKPSDWSRLIDFDASIDPVSLKYRTIPETNVVTCTCTTSNTGNAFLVVCGKGLHSTTSRLGGCVTFVSFRHYTETRTIYLPFAPSAVEPVFWDGSHYVFLLGEKGSVDNRKPHAMAIRVYSKDCTGQLKAPPIRFQPIDIALPSAEFLGPLSSELNQEGFMMRRNEITYEAVSVSAIPSSPPSIILVLRSKLPDALSVIVLNCTVSICHQGGGFATVLQSSRRLEMKSAQKSDIWCTSGQVSEHIWKMLYISYCITTNFSYDIRVGH